MLHHYLQYSQLWKQPKCPQRDEWINGTQLIYQKRVTLSIYGKVDRVEGHYTK